MLQEKELYWLAGLLEGEASFSPKRKCSPIIAIEMTDEDIIKRVCDIFGTKYCKPKVRKDTHKQSYKTSIRGSKAIEIMKEILPIMGNRRKEKIQECISSYVIEKRGLSIEQENEIKRRFSEGEKPKQIAKDFPVSFWRVYQIVRTQK